jgi:hypothetical protein
MDDVPILEVYSRKRAADLSAQLDIVDRRKLAKEAQACFKIAHERPAHSHLREWCWWRRGGWAFYAVGVGKPYDHNGRDYQCGDSPKCAARRSRGTPFSFFGIRPIDGFTHLATLKDRSTNQFARFVDIAWSGKFT